MAINALSLPIDVPWKRLCVSNDMIDRKVCDRKFPYRWRSSVAVFSYQPPDEDQEYEGMTVSYLKVACTITGFQPDPEEVGIKNRKASSYWNDPEVIASYTDIVSKYYGCYGALLEVAVAPAGSKEQVAKIPLSQYPYFIDFEPKKRELYELVSETGEVMSRSLENVNVHKGTTTTDSHENLDVFLGQSGQVQVGQGGGGAAFQSEWGTRDLSQEQYTNLRTTDQGREKRETFSHTTQLTQMYHQFSSYHLGTNRAVFFMLPRPHIIQSELTFVNGPRLLEGIQEIFLVVMRPKATAEICVEAYLETAHIAQLPINENETSTGTLELHIFVSAIEHDDSTADTKEDSETYSPPEGWEVDLANNGGFKIESVSYVGYDFGFQQPALGPEAKVTEATADHVTVWGRVSAFYSDDGVDDFYDGQLDVTVTVYIRKKEGKVAKYDNTLYLTGRGVCCCPDERGKVSAFGDDTVVYETPLEVADGFPIGPEGRTSVRDANRMRAEIGRQIMRSINHPDRYPFGSVRFTDTQFVGSSMAKLVRGPTHGDNNRLMEISGVEPTIREKVAAVYPKASRAKLLSMTPAESADRFGLEYAQAQKLRRALLGLEGPEPDPQTRWDRPGRRRREQTVPDVVGLPLDKARRAIQRARFSVGDITYNDSANEHDIVLNQQPDAESQALSLSRIDLVVATGARVRIPQVVGKPLTEALIMLREAGLDAEPELVFAESRQVPRNHVLDVTPEMRTNVTPRSNVVLQVSSGFRK